MRSFELPLIRLVTFVIVIGILYLLFWPVAIDPVAWRAPPDTGLVDPFEPNVRLRKAHPIDLGVHEGPEDIAGGPDGLIYTSTSDGKIVRFDMNGGDIGLFADVGGRPLGLEFDANGNLLVANAYLGVQRVSPDGQQIEILTEQVDGVPIIYANDIAVARNGNIYFSDSSQKFGARQLGGSYEASLADIMEHGGHGRILRYDPVDKSTKIVIDGLNFANGIAVSENQQYLVIAETGSYRIVRHTLTGPHTGKTETVIDNLPGFPDNINNGLNGRFWVGLVAPRSQLLDELSDKPWLRKLVQKLPASLRPKAARSAHVIAITDSGEVLMNLQDDGSRLAALTGIYETSNALWISTLFGNQLGRLDKRDLASP